MLEFRKENPNNNDALLREAEGLNLLAEQINLHEIGQLSIPYVVNSSPEQLCLQRINSVSPSKTHFEQLALGLAKLHNIVQAHFGLEKDNYIGLSPQFNQVSHNWGRFFVDFRLSPQIKMIRDRAIAEHFNKVLKKKESHLIEFLNASCGHPSILHGDLWSGNVMFENESKVYLIDPAIYFGDSEADIAMTEMFGGFSEVFYSRYNSARPLHKDYPIKRQIYNLYHCLNHYNLFGSSYLSSCKAHLETIEAL